MAVAVSPERTRAPRAVTAKETRRRIGPATRLTATMPTAPAAYRKPISELVAGRTRRANRTSWESAVEATKLISAIMIEMERSTGLDQTQPKPSRTSSSRPGAADQADGPDREAAFKV